MQGVEVHQGTLSERNRGVENSLVSHKHALKWCHPGGTLVAGTELWGGDVYYDQLFWRRVRIASWALIKEVQGPVVFPRTFPISNNIPPHWIGGSP